MEVAFPLGQLTRLCVPHGSTRQLVEMLTPLARLPNLLGLLPRELDQVLIIWQWP